MFGGLDGGDASRHSYYRVTVGAAPMAVSAPGMSYQSGAAAGVQVVTAPSSGSSVSGPTVPAEVVDTAVISSTQSVSGLDKGFRYPAKAPASPIAAPASTSIGSRSGGVFVSTGAGGAHVSVSGSSIGTGLGLLQASSSSKGASARSRARGLRAVG